MLTVLTPVHAINEEKEKKRREMKKKMKKEKETERKRQRQKKKKKRQEMSIVKWVVVAHTQCLVPDSSNPIGHRPKG